MLQKPVLMCLTCLPVCAQVADAPALTRQAEALRALVQQAPRLGLRKTVFHIQPPGPDFGIGYPSAVAMDRDGLIYVLQRSEEPGRPLVAGKADPALVV